MNTNVNITPGERRELRSVVKGQFRVLRAEVRRREQEMVAEVEQQLLDRFRDQERRIAEARREIADIYTEATRQAQEVARRLTDDDVDLSAKVDYGYRGPELSAGSKTRDQLHRAALKRIPNVVGDANLALDRQEVDLLRKLSEGALQSEQATQFLGTIPTVGELVPTARLRELAGEVE